MSALSRGGGGDGAPVRRFTLRARVIAYFVILHVFLGAGALLLFLRNRPLLFLLEAAFAGSLIVGYRLFRAVFVPFDLVESGAALIGDGDFSSRFVEIGQPEIDRLIDVYNRMIDRLREERLAVVEQSSLLQKIVEESPSGIVLCGFDGRVAQMNPAAVRLLPWNLGDSPSTPEIAPPRRLRIRQGEFRDHGFQRTFFIVDEMTEDLRRSEKNAYDKLIRMMSHEVNNSTGAVTSLLQSVLEFVSRLDDDGREDYVTALTVASARIDALSTFMNGFANVVRIPPPNRRAVRVDRILRDVAVLVGSELERRRIRIRIDAEETTATIDGHQFEQVVINIVRNAMESIGDDGEITVILRAAILTVADSGAGIASEDAPSLFTPFFTTKPYGRGLGLTVIQEILTNHGMKFELRNRAAGGAEMRISLSPGGETEPGR